MNWSVLLFVPKTTFERSLFRLRSPKLNTDGHMDIVNWQLVPRDNSLIEFVHNNGHLNEIIDEYFHASLTIRFFNTQTQSQHEFWLSYSGVNQNLFEQNLDIMAIEIAADLNTRGVSLLFDTGFRSAFLKVIESLDIIWGREATEPIARYRREADYEMYMEKHELEIHPSHLFFIGHRLLSYFNIEQLRSTRTFALWEVKGPNFIFASPFFFYKLLETDHKVISTHSFTQEELGLTGSKIVTEEDLDKATNTSLKELKEKLDLPKSINLRM
jgi:hypothetical protein